MTGWSGSEDGDSNAYTLWLKNITKKRRHSSKKKKGETITRQYTYLYIW